MSHICIFQNFLSDAHRAQIEQTARQAGFVPHFFAGDQLDLARACVQHCEVLFAQSPALLRAAPSTLRWFCCSSAGVDHYDLSDKPDCVLTNASGAYGTTISEHLIMCLLMLMRRMPVYTRAQVHHDWQPPREVRAIQGSPIVCLGTGDLGSTFARKARLLGAGPITGVNRSGRADPAVFDRVLSIDHLDEILPDAHILVMTLPGTAETVNVLSAARIAALPADALVLNVGRGSAIDLDALTRALYDGRIAGAALDVTAPEPLPADHPLWDAPNLVLTPHVAGNMSLAHTRDQAVRLFCDNLLRYAAGQPLHQQVDRTRGY